VNGGDREKIVPAAFGPGKLDDCEFMLVVP
jgi:hypothetical protein